MKTSDQQQLVRQFHEAFGAPVAERPTLIPDDRARLRVRLIAEELQEYARAAGLPVEILITEEHRPERVCTAPCDAVSPCPKENEGHGCGGVPGKLPACPHLQPAPPPTADLVEVADALGDLMYVVLGSGVEHGIRLDPVFREIHRSNMTKDAATDAGGKILKGPRYEPPELAGIVADQQAGKVEEKPRPKMMEQALVAGFHGGWAAAMRTIADELQAQERRARISAGGRQVTLAPGPFARALLARATQPPTPQLVAMKPGETPEQASARVGDGAAPPAAAPVEGPFPSAQEALPVLAGLLIAIAGDRAPRRGRLAEWIALCAFANFARRCAQMDGVLEEVDRAAEELHLLVLAPPANGAEA